MDGSGHPEIGQVICKIGQNWWYCPRKPRMSASLRSTVDSGAEVVASTNATDGAFSTPALSPCDACSSIGSPIPKLPLVTCRVEMDSAWVRSSSAS